MDTDAPLNYFNYYTEVEDTFVRRRGAHMLVSPLDWALIESWKEIGIPLAVVLRGIERAFDAFDKQPRRHRKVNSIFYCQQSVEESFAEHRQSMVGAAEGDDTEVAASVIGGADDADSPFQRERVEAFLAHIADDLIAARRKAVDRAALEVALDRASSRLSEICDDARSAKRLDAEALERDLTSIDAVLVAAIRESASPESVEAAQVEAKAALKAHKKGMEKAFYAQMVENFVVRRLREEAGVPRLSLFFMDR